MNSLKDKVVLITGSSIGIGRETAYEFAKEKGHIIITYYKDKKEAEEVSKKCLSLGSPGTLVLQLNVKDIKSIKETVKKIIEKYKKIDILINNAGIVIWKNFKDQNLDEINDQIETNLTGLITMTKECLPYIKYSIINLSSAAGLQGYQQITTYCATKFGVRGFTQALAEELENIKVYSINPGVIATRMNDFEGMPPVKVAEVILNVAKGTYKVNSGDDVNIWEYVKK